jgi:hypothetical protein
MSATKDIMEKKVVIKEKVKNSIIFVYPLERSRQRLKGIGTAQ